MTSQYVTEPPTSGLVTLITSKGPIDIELFSRETPLACRNFLTLALEGFYDNLVFHRLLPGFIIQSGDPSGTGTGGESIYGEPFAIEPHSRLKFNRRGLLAMAAEEKQNESQFFLTLDAAPELQGKHTLMGRVVGKTIYNLLELAEGVELDEDRPKYPPKLLEVKVVENPFDDLKPRMTKDERRQMEKKEREERRRRKEEEEKRKKGKGKKNTKLLSFGDKEEGEASESAVLKGPKSSHDLLKDDKRLSKQAMELDRQARKEEKAKADSSTNGTPPQPPSTEPAKTTSQREKTTAEPSSSRTSESTQPKASTSASTTGRSFLEQERAKYLASKSSSTQKGDDSLSAILSFQSRLRTGAVPSNSAPKHALNEDKGDEEVEKEYGASDDDLDWQEHKLDAGGRPLLATKGDSLDDYEVLDPREHKANANGKGKENGRREGKRGRDWVDDDRRYSSASRSNDAKGGRHRGDGRDSRGTRDERNGKRDHRDREADRDRDRHRDRRQDPSSSRDNRRHRN